MKVGVGVITVGVRALHDYKLADTSDFFVFTDKERRGPAYARNRVLEHFQNYDHVFIFDDDCWPMLAGWEKYFIDQALEHDVHFMAIPEFFKGKVLGCVGEMVEWSDSLAAITYLSQKAIQTVGGYNPKYGIWGYEDIAFAHRCVYKAKLSTRPGAYCFPLRGLAYIHYEDAYGTTEIQHFSDKEKDEFREKFRPIFDEEIQSDQIYYEFRVKERTDE